MTFRNSSFALAILVGCCAAACGGSTTLEFVGSDNMGGGDTGGGNGTGGTTNGDGGNSGLAGSGGDGGTIVITTSCGDGIIDSDSEACDDGNERSGDGCDFSCEVEAPFSCSGEPSECTTVGNGTLDAGEECDDGNADDGDGCSSAGTVEGSCAEPELLELVEDSSGVFSGTVTVDTSSGGGNVPAAACGGLDLGAGSDRVYQVALPPEMLDLTITLESNFDGILRVYRDTPEACVPAQEAGCVDEVGARDVETFRVHGAAPPLFIVVDGAEAGEDGEFTLTVTEACHIEHLKVHRLVTYFGNGNNSVLSIKNTSPYCAIDLSRAGLALADDGGIVQEALPAQILPPLGVFRGSFVVDAAINPNSYDFVGTLGFFDAVASAAYLCDGPCDLAAGTNVIDVLSVGNFNVTIPGVTFPPLLSVGSSPHSAHVRVAYEGAYPTFLASDWSHAFIVDLDDIVVHQTVIVNDPGDSLPPAQVTADPVQGRVLTTPIPTLTGYESVYMLPVPATVQNPTYISFTVRTGNIPDYGCYTGFGVNEGVIGTGDGYGPAGSLIRAIKSYPNEPSAGWYIPTFNSGNSLVTDAAAWHVFELEDIDWTTFTYDLRFDGVLLESNVLMNDNTKTLMNTFSVNPFWAVDCHFSDVIVRNGPPGRAWESPPVLP